MLYIRYSEKHGKITKKGEKPMTKTKKKIAIICMVLNIILLSQVCFGSVSAFYDAVTGNEVEDRDGGEGEELQAESVCTQEELENAKCPIHGPQCYATCYGTGECKLPKCPRTTHEYKICAH